MTASTTNQPSTLVEILDSDPVVVYDTMCEAATRLVAEHIDRGRRTGDHMAEAPLIQAIWSKANSVDIHDLTAQHTLRAEFDHLREAFDD